MVDGDGVTGFHEAVKGGRLDEVERLLRDDPGLVDAPSGPVSPVLLALFHGHEDVARALARAGAALGPSEAAALGAVDRLEDVRAREGGSIEGPGPTGWTPLHLAAFYGRSAATTWLLEHGARPETRSKTAEANTALHAALAGRRDLDVVRTLLEHGADPAAREALGVTPLHLAASRGDERAVDVLLAAGAAPEPMDDGRLPSALATERGHPELAARLAAIESGAAAGA